jgi:hypothetical protein
MATGPIVLSPDLLAHRYDPQYDAVHFIEVDRRLRQAAPFLIDEHFPDHPAPLVLRRQDAVMGAASSVSSRMAMIFHSAYCCSTLLANAYDRPRQAFSLKEPVLLNDMVGWRHRGADPTKVGPVLHDALTLLARPFTAGEVCVVKPSNVVNGLAAAMINDRMEAGVLLLHAPLEVYLGSIASKGLWGRRWVRDLLLKQLIDNMVDLGFERNDYFLQSDLQVAAVGWLAQHALFARLARQWPKRVRTLDSETLLERPLEVLTALDKLFCVESDDAVRAAIIASIFHRNAKSGTAFDAADRNAAQRATAQLHGEEIKLVTDWAYAVADHANISLTLPQRLVG